MGGPDTTGPPAGDSPAWNTKCQSSGIAMGTSLETSRRPVRGLLALLQERFMSKW